MPDHRTLSLATAGTNSEITTANIHLTFPDDPRVVVGLLPVKFIGKHAGWVIVEDGWHPDFNFKNVGPGVAPLDDTAKLVHMAGVIRDKNLCPNIQFVLGKRDDPRNPGTELPVLYGMSKLRMPLDEAAVELIICHHCLGINGVAKLMNEIWKAQHRCQFLSAFVEDDTMCFASWSRSRVVVTPWFNYVEESHYLGSFLRGADAHRTNRWDPNATLASPNEAQFYAQKLNNDVYIRAARSPSHLLKALAGKARTYKISVLSQITALPKYFLIRAPLTTPDEFFGKGSRTYAAWDIETGRFIQLTESWDVREQYDLDDNGAIVEKVEDIHVWTCQSLLLPLWDGISNLQSVVRLSLRDILQALMFIRHGNIARETVLVNLELNVVLTNWNGYSDTPSGRFFRPIAPEEEPVPLEEEVPAEANVFGPEDDLGSTIWLMIDAIVHLFPAEFPAGMALEYQGAYDAWEQLKKVDRREWKSRMLRKIQDRTWRCKDPLFDAFLRKTVNRYLSIEKGPLDQGLTKLFDWYIGECNSTLQRWHRGSAPGPVLGTNTLGLTLPAAA